MIDLKQVSKEINEILDDKRKEYKLTFEEEGHIYHMLDVNGDLKNDFPSVSTVIKSFCTDFDAEKKSLQMSDGDLIKQKILLENWENAGKYASNKGSRVHYELEKYILTKNNINKSVREPIFEVDEQQIKDSDNMIIAGKKFLDLMELRGCVLIDTEVNLGSPNLRFLGQADNCWVCLNKNKDNVGFIISDHKSNKVKNLEPQSYNGFLKYPFSSEIDYALTHYYIQLSLYARLFKDMLKNSKYHDMPLLGCIIDSLRDDETYQEYRVPNKFVNTLLTLDLKPYIKLKTKEERNYE